VAPLVSKDLKVGNVVFGCKDGTGNWNLPWSLGMINKLDDDQVWIYPSKHNHMPDLFRYAMIVSPVQAYNIAANWPGLVGTDFNPGLAKDLITLKVKK